MALIQQLSQREDSTVSSGGNIDKQVNKLTNKQDNNIIINNNIEDTKKEIIKVEKIDNSNLFNINREDIIKKWEISEKDLNLEIELFISYWTAIIRN